MDCLEHKKKASGGREVKEESLDQPLSTEELGWGKWEREGRKVVELRGDREMKKT